MVSWHELVIGIGIGALIVLMVDIFRLLRRTRKPIVPERTPVDEVMDAFRPIAEEMVTKSGASFASVDRADCFGIVATGNYADMLREVARQLPHTGNNDDN